jgi:hypothetical protein
VLEPAGQAVQFRLSCDRYKPAAQATQFRGSKVMLADAGAAHTNAHNNTVCRRADMPRRT